MSHNNTITITRPDDWHVHLRDGDVLEQTVPDIARYFGRAIVMPNLVPPVVDVATANAYYQRICSQLPEGSQFKPLMTLYLTEQTTAEIVQQASEDPCVHAFKLYPAGATTNAESGINSITASYPILEEMQQQGVPLLIHGEVNDAEVDIFDREARFIDEQLIPIRQRFPELKIVLEHITTSAAVQFIQSEANNLAATITVHHLMYNRNDMLAGGMKPIYYCLPILKRKEHQLTLLDAATSGDSRFFLGTDSAPHSRSAKENSCGCAAGSYTAHAAIELYAEVFDGLGKLSMLEDFASHFGPDFYGLPRNPDKITLSRQAWQVPSESQFGTQTLIPIRAGMPVEWKVITE